MQGKCDILITNKGSGELTFPNSALGLTIKTWHQMIIPILSSQVITIIGPGDSKSLRWYQIGVNGNQAPAGNYSSSVDSILVRLRQPFQLDNRTFILTNISNSAIYMICKNIFSTPKDFCMSHSWARRASIPRSVVPKTTRYPGYATDPFCLTLKLNSRFYIN